MTDPSSIRAVVLARGLGSRMREEGTGPAALDDVQAAAATIGLKGMIPFEDRDGAKRPFLDYGLHRLAEAGISQVGLVIGPEHEQIRQYYRSMALRRLSIDFITQEKALGTANAVSAAERWVGDAPFLVLNADNLYPVDVLTQLVRASGPSLPAFAAASLDLPLERLGTFALVARDARGCLSSIREKPGEAAVRSAGPQASFSMNVWRFDRRIFDDCRTVPFSSRGEQELPQAVGLAVERGVCFEVFDAVGPVLDLSRRTDVATVARALEGERVEL